ncbi:putative zinc finger protein CONSTANS-LIKE 11 [Nicotiana sylvestris]|uniref:Zinc finger protein CONSTANS-LIKE 11 n=1 Tax=Nicotiana tabacum TaxID=4097 RepID=A0A1S4DRN9_TOBAC|nr:PREDICTED: putative zinc finger protein CONSTANS-LIKE 11 [Nicotiana tabacum]
MGPLCDVCGVERAVVYCKPDAAKRCFHCDGSVHSANCLSRKHVRSLICDNCSSEPAIVRCMIMEMCLCERCDSNTIGCNMVSGHQHQKLDYYSGCPSPAEFMTKILSTTFDEMSNNNNNVHNLSRFDTASSLSVNENNCSMVASKLNELASCMKFEPWAIPSPVIPSNSTYLTTYNIDQAALADGSSLPKQSCTTIKDHEIYGANDLAGDVDLDELNSNSSYNIFSSLQQSHSRYYSEDRGLGCLVMEKNLSVIGPNSHVETAVEAPSSVSGTANGMFMNPSCNGNTGLAFTHGPAHSRSLSVSNITKESSDATEYQDCGFSPLFPPCDWNSETSCLRARNEAKMRYNEKKKTRTKQIRYASRKVRANTRRRVKGKFVKAGEAYDYDPLVTRDM